MVFHLGLRNDGTMLSVTPRRKQINEVYNDRMILIFHWLKKNMHDAMIKILASDWSDASIPRTDPDLFDYYSLKWSEVQKTK